MMNFGATTDTGKVREKNEDNFRVDPDLQLFIVADGIGGHLAGEIASYIAVETIQDYFHEHLAANHTPCQELLQNSLITAHLAIRDASGIKSSNSRMGTTVVMAWLPSQEENAWIAHVGDSRAYLVRQATLKLLTYDHTLYLQALREGLLPENPRLWPPRQALSQALGASEVIEPEIQAVPIHAGDQIMLCTDGLTDMIPDQQIEAHLRQPAQPQEICDSLVRTAISNGGEDNITVVLFEIPNRSP